LFWLLPKLPPIAASGREASMIELEFDLFSPLNFPVSVYKSADVPLHTRLRAAAEACKYSQPQLKAIAQVTPNDMAAVLDRARERASGGEGDLNCKRLSMTRLN
jgi:hypothetical protein